MASGFNVVDFMNLPHAERCLVRLLLRHITMSYPQLYEEVAALPADQHVDQTQFDAALEHLIRTEWLIQQVSGGETLYNVNSMQRNTSAGGTIWDQLDLETLDADGSYRIDLHTAIDDHPTRLGGKRKLPQLIWDRLGEPGTETTQEPPARKPTRRSGLFDSLMDGDGESKDR